MHLSVSLTDSLQSLEAVKDSWVLRLECTSNQGVILDVKF